MARSMRLSAPLFKNRPGQTLIEMITVLFIIAMGLVAVLTLTTTNAHNESIGMFRLTASQLAREGIEIARNTRDSNWIAGSDWDTNLKNVGSNHYARIKDAAAGTLFTGVECPVAGCPSGTIFDPYYLLRRAADGTFSHAAGGVNTGFYRRLTLDPLCVDAAHVEKVITSGDCTTAAAGAQAGIQVRVEAGTTTGGRDIVVTEVERLYNWR